MNAVDQPPLLSHFLEQARRHAPAENCGSTAHVIVRMAVPQPIEPQNDMHLLEFAIFRRSPFYRKRLRWPTIRRWAVGRRLNDSLQVGRDHPPPPPVPCWCAIPALPDSRPPRRAIGRARSRWCQVGLPIAWPGNAAGEIIEDDVVRRVFRLADLPCKTTARSRCNSLRVVNRVLKDVD